MTNDKITLRDIYEVVEKSNDKMDRRMCELEDRVNCLEDFKARILGMAAVIAAFVGSATAWIWKRVTNEV